MPIVTTTILYMSYKTILFTTAKTLGLINYIITPNINYNITDQCHTILIESDIKKKIAKIHQLLLDIDDNQPTFIKMAINDISESIDNINKCLENYINLKEKHQMLYFNVYRSIDLEDLIKMLSLHIKLLNIRFDDLLKFVQISNKIILHN